MPLLVRQVLLGIGVVLLQFFFFGRLGALAFGAFPDVVLLFVAAQAIRFGRLGGAATGFAMGFVMDAIYGTWGAQMFAKTLVGFAVGLFGGRGESTRLQPLQAFGGALLMALVHNGILVIIMALSTGARTPGMLWGLWLGSALFTALVAVMVAAVRRR